MNPQDPQAFERLLANCADEPIRFPGAIQPHGLLVTLSEPDLQIQQVSANVQAMFGISAESLLGLPLAALSGSEAANAVQQAAVYATLADAPPLALTLLGREYEGLLHRDKGILVLELELKPDASQIHSTMNKVRNLSRMLQRLQAAKLRLTEAAYELLVANCQGNLFAAKQAIERLTIHPQAQNIIDDTLLTELLDDFSQFNTFALSDAILGADWPKAHRIAARLQAENPRDTTLITWLLQRDASLLIGLHNEAQNSHGALYKQYNIYDSQQRRYQTALAKHPPGALRLQLRLAAKLDRITKGAEPGDYWQTLKQHLINNQQRQPA